MELAAKLDAHREGKKKEDPSSLMLHGIDDDRAPSILVSCFLDSFSFRNGKLLVVVSSSGCVVKPVQTHTQKKKEHQIIPRNDILLLFPDSEFSEKKKKEASHVSQLKES